MTYDTAEQIYQIIRKAKNQGLVKMLLDSAVEYSHIRAGWALSSTESRIAMDAARTRSHNAFIDLCNALSRNMATNGEDSSWRETMGPDRKEIGDFACYVHCFLGISAR